MANPSETTGYQQWVKDYNSNRWLDSSAIIVQSKNIHSPMSLGFAAFATKDEAENFIRQNTGQILKAEQLDAVVTTWNADKATDKAGHHE